MMRRQTPPRLPPEKAVRERLRKKKTKASCGSKNHRRQPANGLQALSIVDHIEKVDDGTFRLPVRGERFFDCVPVESLERKTFESNTYYKIGIYTGNEVSLVKTDNPNAALNKWANWFGSISRNRHFRFALRCLVVAGCSRRQLISIMRIRDLKMRGNYLSFKKNIIKYSFSFPKNVREAASSLSSKSVKK